MTKHSRKIRKSEAEKIESPVTEEQLAPVETQPETTEQAPETSQDVPETVEEPSADTGTEEEVAASEESSEDVGGETLNESVEGESQTETEEAPIEAVTTGRRSAIKDDSLVKVLMTENFQRKGTYSFKYNEDLIANGDLTAKKAIEELGVPRHHLLYLSKEGKVEIVNG